MRILVSQAKVIESELKNPPLRSKTTFNINHEQERAHQRNNENSQDERKLDAETLIPFNLIKENTARSFYEK